MTSEKFKRKLAAIAYFPTLRHRNENGKNMEILNKLVTVIKAQ